jgi:hypothetical protein
VSYDFDDEHDVDPEKIARAQELARRLKLMGVPQRRYLTRTRKLPAEAVRRCSADIRALAPPIPFFGAADHGVVSLIRDAAGEIIGFAVEACGPCGEKVERAGRTLRRFFNLTEKRLSGGLFCAVAGAETDRAVMVEGHLAKALAAAALYPDWNVYGWGSRPWLGLAIPPEREILILEDAEPADA